MCKITTQLTYTCIHFNEKEEKNRKNQQKDLRNPITPSSEAFPTIVPEY